MDEIIIINLNPFKKCEIFILIITHHNQERESYIRLQWKSPTFVKKKNFRISALIQMTHFCSVARKNGGFKVWKMKSRNDRDKTSKNRKSHEISNTREEKEKHGGMIPVATPLRYKERKQ